MVAGRGTGKSMPRGNPRLRTANGDQNLVGPRVRIRRKELKLTQETLCARLALLTEGRWNPSPGDIYRIQTQTRIVSDLELVALATVLDCDLLWLLGNAADPGSSPVPRP
jgi:transcriptional regulator with XRE-family HTH domain